MQLNSPNHYLSADPCRPFGYEEWQRAVTILLGKYPAIQYQTIGHSVQGREIGAIRIGTGSREIHYNGAMHANEWITALLLTVFVEELADSEAQQRTIGGYPVAELLQKTSLWLVPMVNPDGVELVIRGLKQGDPWTEQLLQWNQGKSDFSDWKANIRGVDLNDQFPAHWETERRRRAVESPAPRDYPGEAPLTEPEAQALAQLTEQRQFQLVMAFHTQGREIYWNYRNLEPGESVVWAERFGQVSGYIPVKLEGSDAGYKDWFIQQFRRPGFTIEAGFGVNPLPLVQFPDLYREVAAIMLQGLLTD